MNSQNRAKEESDIMALFFAPPYHIRSLSLTYITLSLFNRILDLKNVNTKLNLISSLHNPTLYTAPRQNVFLLILILYVLCLVPPMHSSSLYNEQSCQGGQMAQMLENA